MMATQGRVMASRSARSPRNRKVVDDYDDEGGFAALVGRHRFALAGTTAFIVAFSYVASNAIWYQPHAHASAFFSTRPLTAPLPSGQSGNAAPASDVETVIRLERERVATPETVPVPRERQEAARQTPQTAPVPQPASQTAQGQPAEPRPAGDPLIADVQRVLKGLNIYTGDVDGLTGPQTRAAVQNYRRIVGLSATAEVDDQLLAQLGIKPRAVAAAAPQPAPASPSASDSGSVQTANLVPSAAPVPRFSPGTDLIETSSAGPREDAMVMRIQAGLKAFGNDGIDIDGVVGARTKSAILEFQSLFGLPETGEPDQALLTKMREIGLTD